jgi:N-acetylmuramoyl-L-alanine amidase
VPQPTPPGHGAGPAPRLPDRARPLGELIAQQPAANSTCSRRLGAAPRRCHRKHSGPRHLARALKRIVSASDPHPPAATDRLIIIALDPGHGGEDPGAIGPGGTREKDVVLRLAPPLRERINATSVNGNAMRAYLTRDADFFVPLHVRVQKARRVQADLFISLHADAFFTPDPQGCQRVCPEPGRCIQQRGTLDGRQGEQGRPDWRRQRANQGRQVQRALLDMSTTAQINDSLKLGGAMLGEIGRVGKLHKPRVEQAGFAVLKAPDIPSVLVEAAFISNPGKKPNSTATPTSSSWPTR